MREEEFIKRYNKAIERYNKAEQFLQADFYVNKKTGEKIKYKGIEEEFKAKEKWIPEFHKIVRELSAMITECKEITGQEMELEEKLNGFRC